MIASHKTDAYAEKLTASERSSISTHRLPRFLIIGAGRRGTAYASAVHKEGLPAIIAAVAEPVRSTRLSFGKKYVWGLEQEQPREDQAFESWQHFLEYEKRRREAEVNGEKVYPGIDGIIVCTQDQTHKEILHAFGPLKLHVLCEKPIATTLQDCQDIYLSLLDGADRPEKIFSTGHVLRYSPHNMLLRRLLLEEKVIGEIISVEHTEPVGWFHFSHSYVRGNWRKESYAAPSLLCKSCHDIDFLLWLLCYRTDQGKPAHMPSLISSTGNLSLFTKRRKPKAAGNATNCFSCPHEQDCDWSAKKLYVEKLYDQEKELDWPICVVLPDIEDIVATSGLARGREVLIDTLSADYDASTTPESTIESKQWYGRCVWESDNDVLDDQIVTLTWDDDSQNTIAIANDGGEEEFPDRGPKTALFHMAAFTEAQSKRRGKISGTHGELQYDGNEIRVYKYSRFKDPDAAEIYTPPKATSGHDGGDSGLMNNFSQAVEAAINGKLCVEEAQAKYVGCTLKEAFMSHAMVFAAEEARRERKIVDWQEWWAKLEEQCEKGVIS
ncbi:streptomycin biosynthesis protein StrI [Naviculisporaceae sp. PSN 640]